jgi:hypothetical protein
MHVPFTLRLIMHAKSKHGRNSFIFRAHYEKHYKYVKKFFLITIKKPLLNPYKNIKKMNLKFGGD